MGEDSAFSWNVFVRRFLGQYVESKNVSLLSLLVNIFICRNKKDIQIWKFFTWVLENPMLEAASKDCKDKKDRHIWKFFTQAQLEDPMLGAFSKSFASIFTKSSSMVSHLVSLIYTVVNSVPF